MFEPLENTKPFLKMGFFGFAGDGKTYTASLVAIMLHKLIKSEKPIAAIDTELSFKALRETLFDPADVKVVVDKSRSLENLKNAIRQCEEGLSDILIIDSLTHIYERFISDYLESKNKLTMEFQDWAKVKPKWKKDFSDIYVQANCHIIFCGRAGYEYESEIDEKTKKRDIYKSGIKMKAENETAFEPDLLVLMEKVQNLIVDKPEDREVYRIATIIKDRTTKIDGLTAKNPTAEFFFPAIKILLDGKIKEAYRDEIPNSFADLQEKFDKQSKIRRESLAEIDGNFELMGLGTGAKDKQAKAAILKHVFGTTAIEVVENLPVSNIQKGSELIKNIASQYIDYTTTCTDNGTKPEESRLGEIVKSVVENHKKLMVQLN